LNSLEWKSEADNTLKAKKEAGFSLLPPRLRSSSHCHFNDGNSTDIEVGCTARLSSIWLGCTARLSSIWLGCTARLSSIWLSFVWTN
jgi:hypothetical protein